MQTQVTSIVPGTSNTTSGYFDGSEAPGWVFDAFGDNITYSTNTLETAVSITTNGGSNNA